MDRQDKDKIDTNARLKQFGKITGNWYCDECNHKISSFLYNWEMHIPEICPGCNKGKMIENKNERESPPIVYIIDRSREKNWDKGLSPGQQASVLLGETDPY